VHVVVTGSRDWSDAVLIRAVIGRLPPGSTVIVGGARGADGLAEEAARASGHTVVVERADWRAHGRGAGMRRNRLMLDRLAALPDTDRRVIGFWLGRSPGTRDCLTEAMRRGLPLEVHWRPEPPPAAAQGATQRT
jgi:hypothetical protein